MIVQCELLFGTANIVFDFAIIGGSGDLEVAPIGKRARADRS